MKKSSNIRSFLAGVLVTLLVVSMVPSALAAAGVNITVYPGVSIYMDDTKLNPTDANGKPVEVFIYNGTTYLPVRAVSEALGQVVQWEGSTRSVYIGKHTGTVPAIMLRNLDYFSGTADNRFYTAASRTDNTGAVRTDCITATFERTYLINGQYSSLSGMIFQDYAYRSDSGKVSLNIYGDGKLLYTYTYDGTGLKPVPFSVDLTGVLELNVQFTTPSHWVNSNGDKGYRGTFSLGEVGLWA